MSCLETISLHDCCNHSRQRDGSKGKIYPQHIRPHIQVLIRYYMYQWTGRTAPFRNICQNDTKNNSTVFCGLGHHFNGSKSNDSLFKVPNIYIYILPRNNLNKNYFRFSKETNQKERRKSTSYAEGNEVSRQFDIITCSQIFWQDAAGNTFIFSILLR